MCVCEPRSLLQNREKNIQYMVLPWHYTGSNESFIKMEELEGILIFLEICEDKSKIQQCLE